MDLRFREYARLAVAHSMHVQSGDTVLIDLEASTAAFAELVGEEVIRAGGHPVFRFGSPSTTAVRLLEGADEQVTFVSPIDHTLPAYDCRVAFDAPSGRRKPSFDPERMRQRRDVLRPIHDQMHDQRWVYMLLPTRYLAARLGISWQACKDLIFGATIGVNWEQVEADGQGIKTLFDAGSIVRIVADGTDITFNIDGRRGCVCAGRRNLPDGECFYSPREESVQGIVTFHDPQFSQLGVIKNIQLVFKDGEVTEAHASEGIHHLETLLGMDAGARRLGEFGIGFNRLVPRMTGNILLDEKIAGTVHLALGNAYKDADGTNTSALHWDMILDLRSGGQIYLDGRLVFDNGLWLATGPGQHFLIAG